MPNINLTDGRSRDAVVKAESTGVTEEVRYVDNKGHSAHNRKILKATIDHDYDTLVAKYKGDAESLGKALVDSDPEVDMEKCGLFLWGVSKVFVNSSDGIVYRIEQSEIVRDPSGKVKEERARERAEANIDTEIPLTWTGRKIAKDEAVRRFAFSSKLQIVHVNGLTYDFLYGMAKELAEENALMMVGGGSKGRDPLVFRRGSVPYRGFLEGRVEGDKYILLLHLSNLELKVPEETKKDLEEEKATSQEKAEKTEVEKDKPADADKPQKTKKSDAKKSLADSKTSTEDFGVWLKSIRMGKYLKLFVANEIDVDVLPDLSDDDLKELDIPVGSRKRLLKAVKQADDLHEEVAKVAKAKRDESDS